MLILLNKLNIIFDYLMFQNNLVNYVIYFIIFSLICNILLLTIYCFFNILYNLIEIKL